MSLFQLYTMSLFDCCGVELYHVNHHMRTEPSSKGTDRASRRPPHTHTHRGFIQFSYMLEAGKSNNGFLLAREAENKIVAQSRRFSSP